MKEAHTENRTMETGRRRRRGLGLKHSGGCLSNHKQKLVGAKEWILRKHASGRDRLAKENHPHPPPTKKSRDMNHFEREHLDEEGEAL